MKNVMSASVLALLIAACSGNAPEPEGSTRTAQADSPKSAPSNYQLPSEDTPSLITSISAARNPNGAVVVSGETQLPAGTKLWIERRAPSGKVTSKADVFINEAGGFSSQPFTDDGKAPKEGLEQIGVVSYFNKAWQPEHILAITGEGGMNLPSSALEPDDPEFPDHHRHLNETHAVSFPEIPGDIVAIAAVKNAKLYVQGQGQAVDTVEDIVAIFAQSAGFNPLGWRAEKDGDKWIVTLDSAEGASRREAKWEFDPTSGKVRYLDPLSKILSWIPAD